MAAIGIRYVVVPQHVVAIGVQGPVGTFAGREQGLPCMRRHIDPDREEDLQCTAVLSVLHRPTGYQVLGDQNVSGYRSR
jgi:hypothetical protein